MNLEHSNLTELKRDSFARGVTGQIEELLCWPMLLPSGVIRWHSTEEPAPAIRKQVELNRWLEPGTILADSNQGLFPGSNLAWTWLEPGLNLRVFLLFFCYIFESETILAGSNLKEVWLTWTSNYYGWLVPGIISADSNQGSFLAQNKSILVGLNQKLLFWLARNWNYFWLWRRSSKNIRSRETLLPRNETVKPVRAVRNLGVYIYIYCSSGLGGEILCAIMPPKRAFRGQ